MAHVACRRPVAMWLSPASTLRGDDDGACADISYGGALENPIRLHASASHPPDEILPRCLDPRTSRIHQSDCDEGLEAGCCSGHVPCRAKSSPPDRQESAG